MWPAFLFCSHFLHPYALWAILKYLEACYAAWSTRRKSFKLGKLQVLQRICHHNYQPWNRSELFEGQENSTMQRVFLSEYPHVSISNFFLLSIESIVYCFHRSLSHVTPISPHYVFSLSHISVASFISPGWSHTWLSFNCRSNCTELPWTTIMVNHPLQEGNSKAQPLSLLHVEHKSICLSPKRVTCQFQKINHAWDKLRRNLSSFATTSLGRVPERASPDLMTCGSKDMQGSRHAIRRLILWVV